MQTVRISSGSASLCATLVLPVHAMGLAIFAHASASGRQKPRNHYLTRFLAQRGVAVLLTDLLTLEEENEDRATGCFQDDPRLLAQRLESVAHWIRYSPERRLLQHLRVGCLGFGAAGTGALIAGANDTAGLATLIVAEGRPDQAGDAVTRIEISTLLILGETHDVTRRMNEIAFSQLRCERDLKIIRGAMSVVNGDALEDVGVASARWLLAHLQEQQAESHPRTIAPVGVSS